MARYLVVAYQTAGSPRLRAALAELQDGDAEFVLLVPATAGSHLRIATAGESYLLAREAADRAGEAFAADGIQLAGVRVRDPNPVVAVEEELDEHPGYTAIVISTFAPGASRWLKMDVVSRLRRVTSLPITHVVAEEASATH